MNIVCINRNNKDRYRFTCSPPLFFFFVGFQNPDWCITSVVLLKYTQNNPPHPTCRTSYTYYTYDPLQMPISTVKRDFQVFKSRLDKMESASAQDYIKIANQLINWQKYSCYKENRKMIRLCQWLVVIQLEEEKFFAEKKNPDQFCEMNIILECFSASFIFCLCHLSFVKDRGN